MRFISVGKLLDVVTEYKYLGLLFTPDLKFDRHITELTLPKVRRIVSLLRHNYAHQISDRSLYFP